MATITISLDETTKKDFKKAVLNNDKTMKEVAIELIKEYIKENKE